MAQTQIEREEVGQRGKQWYADAIRANVEREENIGNMVIIDVETGEYEVDPSGLDSAKRLRERHPDAKLYGIRIGYRAADAIGGAMERVSQ